MLTLAQFLMRLCFGLTLGMAITSPRLVSGGYYRNHLYVTLGLATLAGLALSLGAGQSAAWAWATAGASYVGAVLWLYERQRAGRTLLLAVALVAAIGALHLAELRQSASPATLADESVLQAALWRLQPLTSGLLLGFTMAAMLLGHWYLNSPGMQTAPLRRLLLAMAAAAVLQSVVCGTGLALQIAHAAEPPTMQWLLFVAMRWLFGLPSVLLLTGMAWATLKIPNTQSATGILYVAVIGTFVGETMSLLLSAESSYPL